MDRRGSSTSLRRSCRAGSPRLPGLRQRAALRLQAGPTGPSIEARIGASRGHAQRAKYYSRQHTSAICTSESSHNLGALIRPESRTALRTLRRLVKHRPSTTANCAFAVKQAPHLLRVCFRSGHARLNSTPRSRPSTGICPGLCPRTSATLTSGLSRLVLEAPLRPTCDRGANPATCSPLALVSSAAPGVRAVPGAMGASRAHRSRLRVGAGLRRARQAAAGWC